MNLVTGGTGLLGSHLLLDLALAGERVRAIYRDQRSTARTRRVFGYYLDSPDPVFSRIEWVKADLLDRGALEDALEGVTVVYHCAAMVSFDPCQREELIRVNVGGTENLVDLSVENRIKKFCHVSSIATLGRPGDGGLMTEESYWIPSNRNSAYSISKYGAEREVWRGMEEGLEAVIINPSVILGPGFWETGSALFRLIGHGFPFYPAGSNGFVDVRDVSRAMIALAVGSFSRQRFLCSAGNLTYRELFTLIARAVGRPAPQYRAGRFLSSMAWRTERLRSLATGRPPAITRELALTAGMRYAYDGDKLSKAIHLNYNSIDLVVARTGRLFQSDRATRLTNSANQ